VTKKHTNAPVNTLPESFPDSLLACSQPLNLDKETLLFHPEDPVEFLYFIVEGEVVALRYQKDGVPAVMMRHHGGEIFAPASLSMHHYPCAGIAAKNTRLVKIPRSLFQTALLEDNRFSRYYMTLLAQNLKQQCARSERLRLKSVHERVLHYISCESADGRAIALTGPITAWAEELGVEPESLYRSLRKMEQAGEIKRNKRHIEIP